LTEQTIHYTNDIVREAARRVLIESPQFLKLGADDAPQEVNGRTMDLEVLCNLPGRDGALWRQLRYWVAVNAPGLFERSPSPDSTLRRGREIRQEMEEQGLVRPAIAETQ